MRIQVNLSKSKFLIFSNKYLRFKNIPYKIGFKQAFDEAMSIEKPLRVFIMSGTDDDIRST